MQITGSCFLSIAYFSAEYGLHRSLPSYAGGPGFLEGDYLKGVQRSRYPAGLRARWRAAVGAPLLSGDPEEI